MDSKKKIVSLFQRASRLREAGRGREAAAPYRRILAADPARVDANHLLGTRLAGTGNLAAARAHIAR